MRWRAVLLALVSLASAGCWSGPLEERIEVLEVRSADILPIPQQVRFAAIRDMALAPESVWVLDGAPPFVTRISLTTGGAVQSGQRGQGPGEFLYPVAIQPAVDSGEPGAWIWDLGNHRVSVLDTLGASRKSEPLSDDAGFRVRGTCQQE